MGAYKSNEDHIRAPGPLLKVLLRDTERLVPRALMEAYEHYIEALEWRAPGREMGTFREVFYGVRKGVFKIETPIAVLDANKMRPIFEQFIAAQRADPKSDIKSDIKVEADSDRITLMGPNLREIMKVMCEVYVNPEIAKKNKGFPPFPYDEIIAHETSPEYEQADLAIAQNYLSKYRLGVVSAQRTETVAESPLVSSGQTQQPAPSTAVPMRQQPYQLPGGLRNDGDGSGQQQKSDGAMPQSHVGFVERDGHLPKWRGTSVQQQHE